MTDPHQTAAALSEAQLFANLPVFPVALPDDELRLLHDLRGCEWPTYRELDWQQYPAARRLERRGLIKISRHKTDPVAHEPDWFAGLMPQSSVRAILEQRHD